MIYNNWDVISEGHKGLFTVAYVDTKKTTYFKSRQDVANMIDLVKASLK